MRIKLNYQEGQILLITLMVLVVAMVIGLSIATRTITTIRMASQQDNSSRAFSAAEAGIEQALTSVNSTVNGTFTTNNSTYSTTKAPQQGPNLLINNADLIQKDDSADIWLSTYPDYSNPWGTPTSATLTIYWGNSIDNCTPSESTNTMAALEIAVISGTKAAPVLNTYAYDPCADRRNPSVNSRNHFTAPGGGTTITQGGISKTFSYSAPITVSSGLLARVIPLYAGTYIGVTGSIAIPSQGTLITSTGISGGTQRKVVSFRGFPKAPAELFPYLIFSPK